MTLRDEFPWGCFWLLSFTIEEKHSKHEPMNRNLVNSFCEKLPGAAVDDPWGGGHDAWKVGGKMFASIGTKGLGVSVKTESIETAQMLIEVGVGKKAPYFHRSWVMLPLDAETQELEARLLSSYKIIRGGLSKRVQASLGPLEEK